MPFRIALSEEKSRIRYLLREAKTQFLDYIKLFELFITFKGIDS